MTLEDGGHRAADAAPGPLARHLQDPGRQRRLGREGEGILRRRARELKVNRLGHSSSPSSLARRAVEGLPNLAEELRLGRRLLEHGVVRVAARRTRTR